MPHITEWYVQDKIAVARFEGAVGAADIQAAWQKILALLAANSVEKAHMLVDLRERGEMLPDAAQMQSFFEIGKSIRTHSRIIIVLDPKPPPTLSLVGPTTARILGIRLFVVTSLANAKARLLRIDPTLVFPDDDEDEA